MRVGYLSLNQHHLDEKRQRNGEGPQDHRTRWWGFGCRRFPCFKTEMLCFISTDRNLPTPKRHKFIEHKEIQEEQQKETNEQKGGKSYYTPKQKGRVAVEL